MTEQQIDRDRLAEWRDRTARIVEKYGTEAWAEIRANEVVAIIDALTQAEARIKAVQHLIDQADEMGEWAITCTRLQWAIDGSNPPPGA